MKGVSPLIAAVLLIAIVLVIGTLALDWLPSVFRTTTGNVDNKTASCSTAGVVIDNVYLDIGSNVGRIIVRNSGFDDDSIVSASIINKKGQSTTNLTEFPISLPIGSQSSISLNISDMITSCDNFSSAFVSTACAISAEFRAGGRSPVCTN